MIRLTRIINGEKTVLDFESAADVTAYLEATEKAGKAEQEKAEKEKAEAIAHLRKDLVGIFLRTRAEKMTSDEFSKTFLEAIEEAANTAEKLDSESHDGGTESVPDSARVSTKDNAPDIKTTVRQ